MKAKQFLTEYKSEAKNYIKGVEDTLLYQMVDEYAEQQAKAFMQWRDNNGWIRTAKGYKPPYSNTASPMGNEISLQKLYEYFRHETD